MAILCLGGTFNPIHHGHLLGARAAAEQLQISQVKLIPSRQPPHKPGRHDLAPALVRAAMCQAAVSHNAMFSVDLREIHRDGNSYTVDTLMELHAEGEKGIHWIIGVDQLLTLPTWHQVERLRSLCKIIVLKRAGQPLNWDVLPPDYHDLRHNVVTWPLVEISSTDIRQRVAKKLPIDFLTPLPVIELIAQHRLYQVSA